MVDLRRGLDLLLSRPDVDRHRVVYIGHSLGAQWGAILTSVDRRMKATVLIGGVPDAAAIWLESVDRHREKSRPEVRPERGRRFR